MKPHKVHEQALHLDAGPMPRSVTANAHCALHANTIRKIALHNMGQVMR